MRGEDYFRPAPFLYGQTLIACAAAISGPFSVCYLFKGLKYTKYSCALKKASYEKIPRFCLTAPTIRVCLGFVDIKLIPFVGCPGIVGTVVLALPILELAWFFF